MALLLGIDLGSSSVKVALVDAGSGQTVASATSPKEGEMGIAAPQPGYAEQDPELWWQHIKAAVKQLEQPIQDVAAIGISYQMHGLVLADEQGNALRPSIIWCDSRATEAGARIEQAYGAQLCRQDVLNAPGNFTIAKLAWVAEQEPELYAKAKYVLLPGDWLAMRLTGEAYTTQSGLSEQMAFDFSRNRLAKELLAKANLKASLYPKIVGSFEHTGATQGAWAKELGLPEGIPIKYRAGDQPNNAFALGVALPGEVAANAGTSGVLYGVSSTPKADGQSRVNSFAHVTYTPNAPRIGVLACVNGTGILNSWLRGILSAEGSPLPFSQLNAWADNVAPGSDGLHIYPYGNGAERTLCNRNPGAQILNLSLTRHGKGHLARAVQEGIAYALAYSLEIMREMGVEVSVLKAGKANMFLSPVFARIMAALSNCPIQLYDTDGAQGAARAAGVGLGLYTAEEANRHLTCLEVIEPEPDLVSQYRQLYQAWKAGLPI